MFTRLQHWFQAPRLRDAIEQQHAAAMQGFALTLVGAAILWTPLPFFTTTVLLGRLLGLAAPLLVAGAGLAAFVSVRRDNFRRAIRLMALSLIGAIALLLIAWGLQSGGMMLIPCLIPITLMGLLTDRRGVLLAGGLSGSVAVVIALLEHSVPPRAGFAPLQGNGVVLTVGTFLLTLLVLGVLVYTCGSKLQASVRSLQAREAALQQSQAALEAALTERAAALAAAQEHAAHLTEAVTALRTSEETVRRLSAPVIPVTARALVAPIIGVLDSERARHLTEQVLASVVRRQAQHVVFDVTGLAVVDPVAAQALLQTTQAVQLLGARVMLAGVQPEVAQALVALHMELQLDGTYPTLADAIDALLRPADERML